MNNGKISASKLLAGLVPADFIREEVQVELVTTDSREVRPGCIFVAFPGEKLTATILRPKHWRTVLFMWW